MHFWSVFLAIHRIFMIYYWTTRRVQLIFSAQARPEGRFIYIQRQIFIIHKSTFCDVYKAFQHQVSFDLRWIICYQIVPNFGDPPPPLSIASCPPPDPTMKDAESETGISSNEGKLPIPAIKVDEERTSQSLEGPPDGGTRAWLVVSGAFCILFSTLGYANSFGVFQEYYLSHQLREESPDNIAWIGSLSVFLQLSTSAIAGPLFDRFGTWVCLPHSLPYKSEI